MILEDWTISCIAYAFVHTKVANAKFLIPLPFLWIETARFTSMPYFPSITTKTSVGEEKKKKVAGRS